MRYHKYPHERDRSTDTAHATQDDKARYLLGFGLSGAILALIAALFLTAY